jgi:tetratricopeptide (TPR) repeat protein
MILAGRLADDEDVRRFRVEAEAAAQVDHPGIVPVYEVNEHQGQHFFSMGFVEGESLAQRVARGPLPPPEAAALVQAAAEAMACAHARGVIHRDLKPSNILVGADGRPRVTDFGVAKRVEGDSGLTAEGQIIGTPSYMPPEQAQGKREVGPEADVYALGAVLYTLLVGRPPFQAATVIDTVRQVLEQEPVSPRQFNRSLPRDLETICLKCLRKEPQKRYSGAAELAEDLARFRDGRPIKARRVSGLERAVKWVKRRPLAAALAGALLLLVAAGGSTAWLWLQQHATALARRQQADREARLAIDAARDLLKEGWERNSGEKLASALAEADKAVKVADSGGASDDVRQEADELRKQAQAKVDGARKNAVLLAALLNVTAPRETKQYVRGGSGTMTALAEPSVEEQFVQAFHRWDPDIDIDRTLLETLVARLAGQPTAVVQEVVAGLDTWMLDRRGSQRPKAAWRRLFRLAEELDKNEDSRDVRRLLVSGDLEREAAIKALARRLLPWSALVEAPPGRQTQRLREQAKVIRKRGPVLGLVTLARALEGSGSFKEAEWLLRAAVTVQPDREVLLDALGKQLERRGPSHRAEAIACYRAARALRPLLGIALGKALLQAGSVAEAEAIFRDLRYRQPNNPEISFNLGDALFAQKRYAEAEGTYREATTLNPDFSAAHNNLGGALFAQKRYAEAEAAGRKAIQLKPNDAQAHSNLGVALTAQKRHAEAEAACRKAIQLKPDFAEGHYNLGVALRAQKKLDAAEAAYRKAVALKPDYAAAHSYLGVALSAQTRHAEAEAEAACRKAVALKPDLPEAHNNLGGVLHAQKRYVEAEAAYRKAVALRPDYPEAYNNLGNVLRDQKRYMEAESACRKALELKPDSANVYNSLGTILHDQKKLKEAEAAHRKAIALKPDSAGAYYNLGVLLYERKRLGEAEAANRKAIALKPDYAWAYNNLGNVLREQKKLGEAEASLRRTSTSATPCMTRRSWGKRRLPSARPSNSNPISLRRTSTSATPCMTRRSWGKRRLPSARPSNSNLISPRDTMASAMSCASRSGLGKRRPPTARPSACGPTTPMRTSTSASPWVSRGGTRRRRQPTATNPTPPRHNSTSGTP